MVCKNRVKRACREINDTLSPAKKRFPSLFIVYCLSVLIMPVFVFFLFFLSCLFVVQLHGAGASVGLPAQPSGLRREQHAAVNARKDDDVLQRQFCFA